MKKIILVLLSQMVVLSANAAIVCTGTTSFGSQLKLTIDQSTAHLIVDPSELQGIDKVFNNIEDEWDGHETGLITAPGLSVKYQNDYGCIKNVVVTTNIRGGGVGYIESISIPRCSGGTTPDSICLGHQAQ